MIAGSHNIGGGTGGFTILDVGIRLLLDRYFNVDYDPFLVRAKSSREGPSGAEPTTRAVAGPNIARGRARASQTT